MMNRLRSILGLAIQMSEDSQFFPSNDGRENANTEQVPPNSPLEHSSESIYLTERYQPMSSLILHNFFDISLASSIEDVSSMRADEDEKDLNDDSDDSSYVQCGDEELIDMFSECLICTNPLQGRGVHQCKTCMKIWCSSCSGRMLNCAFCRKAFRTRKLNQKLTLFVDRLPLPCRYQSYGCSVLLIANNRRSHEEFCKFQKNAQ